MQWLPCDSLCASLICSRKQAKFFTESRLLQRAIKVQLLSAPVSLGALPTAGAKTSASGLPAPQSVTSNIMIGTA